MMSTNRLAHTVSVVAAAMLVAIAVPASAAGSDPSSTARAAAKPASADPSLDKRQYCVKGSYTGSRVARTICKTRSQWIARTGEDPAKK